VNLSAIQKKFNTERSKVNSAHLGKCSQKVQKLAELFNLSSTHLQMSLDENATLVIDLGSGTCKIGIAGEKLPRSIFSTVVGRAKYPKAIHTCQFKDAYVGNEAQARTSTLDLKYPIQRGIITNWDDAEQILHHIVDNELQVNPSEHPILIGEVPKNPKANREK
jgi:actin beta/gamma 1